MKLIDYYSTILYASLGIAIFAIYNGWIKLISIGLLVFSFYLVYQKETEERKMPIQRDSGKTNLEPPLPEDDLVGWLK